jgi:large subunit ribosomal protein L36
MKSGGPVVDEDRSDRRPKDVDPPGEEGVLMKVRSSLRSLKNKAGSQLVRRNGKIFVINKKAPRFNGRQG